jgi:AcrR family transcriptional regulator
MVDEAQNGRPSVESRRQQILDAACDRVRQSGFHGASMAEIAKAAGLSVGQIYRYFENKEAIIAAIVAQDLAEMREKFAEMERQPGTLLDALEEHLPEGVDKCFDPKPRARWRWRSGRGRAQSQGRRHRARRRRAGAGHGQAMLDRSRKPEWSDAEFQARCETVGLIFDGLVMRAVNHPELDREALTAVLRTTMRHLLG